MGTARFLLITPQARYMHEERKHLCVSIPRLGWRLHAYMFCLPLLPTVRDLMQGPP